MSDVKHLPVFDMERRLHKHSKKIKSAVAEVLKSGDIILGKFVEQFEEAFAKYTGVNYCIGVGNGTDAIEIALRSLELHKGAKVGIAANAGGYSRIAIEAVGYNAIYEDVDEESNCLSIESVLKLIGAGVSTIIVTHLYGRVAPDLLEIAAACKAANVWLIEDCAQAHGSQHLNIRAGSIGDLATFSFYPTKNLGSVGDAGCIVTSNHKLASCARKLRTYGWTDKYDVSIVGGRNSRIDALQAAVLTALLPSLDDENEERRRIVRSLSHHLKSDYLSLINQYEQECNFHLLLVRTKFRSELKKHLTVHGIGWSIHYPIPDHLQSAWLAPLSLSLPITEKLATEILTVPCFPGMTDEEISYLIATLNKFSPKV